MFEVEGVGGRGSGMYKSLTLWSIAGTMVVGTV